MNLSSIVTAAGEHHPRLFHFGRDTVRRVYSSPQIDVPYFKPIGFWVSVEDAWPRLVRSSSHLEGFSLACATEVIIDADRVIWLRGFDDIAAFERSFRTAWPKHPLVSSIGWENVAKTASGLIVTELDIGRLYDARELHWIVNWECASGCIWDASVILSPSENTHASPLDSFRPAPRSPGESRVYPDPA